MSGRSMVPGLVLLSLSATAAAQDIAPSEGFDGHALQLAALDGDPRDPLLLQRPGRFRGGEWFVGGVFEYARGLVVELEEDADGDRTRRPWLDDAVGLNLSVGVAPHERIRLDLAMPLFFHSRGLDGPNGFDVGDLRATAMVALVRPKSGDVGFGLGLDAHLDAPTGASAELLGARTIAGGAGLSASYAVDRLTVTANAGAQINPKVDLINVNGADAFVGGLGVGVLATDTLGINLEGRVSVPFVKAGRPGTETPAELVLTARNRWSNGAFLVGGASAGLSPGVGAGSFRLFLGGGFGRIKGDVRDDCPREPETENGWKDDDGCPDQLAALDVRVTLDGSPVSDVDVALAGPDGAARSVESSTSAVRVGDLFPGTAWTGSASVTCAAGTASATAGDEGSVTPLDVVLVPKRDAEVVLRVIDTARKPVPGASASWKGVARGCVDATTFPLDAAKGEGSQHVGAGTHGLYVQAPGFEVVQRDVIVPDAGQIVVEVVLAPTRVQVTEDEVITLEPVYFDFDKDTIQQRSFGLLDELAATIRQHELTIRVEGHTDWVGTDVYNDDLSNRRAASVVRYLLSKGVPDAQLSSAGFGEARPIETNETDAGRAKNRRVVFTIVKRGK